MSLTMACTSGSLGEHLDVDPPAGLGTARAGARAGYAATHVQTWLSVFAPMSVNGVFILFLVMAIQKVQKGTGAATCF